MFRWFFKLFKRKKPARPKRYKLTRAVLRRNEKWLSDMDRRIKVLENEVMGDPVMRREYEQDKDFHYGPLGSEC